GLVYCSGGLSGEYTVLAVCQIVHYASGLSSLTAVCLIKQRFISSGLSSSVAVCWKRFGNCSGLISGGLQGKENGVNILKSINDGPFKMGMFRETLAEGEEGALHLGPERTRVYSKLSPEEEDRYNADIWATNILLQGFPKDIYTLINHYTDAKDIWDNVKMLLEGFELTKKTGKENGVNILKSIDEGPFKMGMFRETLAEGEEGALHLGPERPRVYSKLSPEEEDRYNADIWATNILLQGFPKDIYTLINHYTDAKDIWDNVKMLLEGFELTKENRESQLIEVRGTMHAVQVQLVKGELRTELRMQIQLNSKFVNNMLLKCGRFVIAVKLNKGLRDSNFDQLKQHQVHANENKMMLDRFTQHTADPLGLMSNVSPQPYY
nr:hypothetical protein [Tanacetum cinerariifolium]